MAWSKSLGLVAGVLLGSAVFAGTANAVPVVFDFEGGDGTQRRSMRFSEGGVNLTVSSNTWNNSVTRYGGAGRVGYWENGLGIQTSTRGDQHFVDGNNGNEALSFYFSQAVKLVSITFSYFDANDDFAFFFDKGKDGGLAGDLVWGKKGGFGDSFYATYTFAENESAAAIGRLFGFGALENNDEFKIASVTVSAVPIPGALPMLLSALGAMGWGARRRFKKSKV